MPFYMEDIFFCRIKFFPPKWANNRAEMVEIQRSGCEIREELSLYNSFFILYLRMICKMKMLQIERASE